MKKFTTGDTVFDIHGNSYSYLSACTLGHAIEAIYDDDDGPHHAEPGWLREVFVKPPRQRLAADLSDIQARIESARAELQAVQVDVHAAQRERQAIIARAKSDPQLTDLYLWLDGKATHLVVLDQYRLQIGTIDEILRSPGRDRSLRLLSLYVDPKESRYSARRAAYSDGSGSCTTCRLASSEEHAKEIAREYIAEKLRSPDLEWSASAWTRTAIDYGVPVSEKCLTALHQEQRKQRDERLANAQRAHERAAQELSQAQADVMNASA